MPYFVDMNITYSQFLYTVTTGNTLNEYILCTFEIDYSRGETLLLFTSCLIITILQHFSVIQNTGHKHAVAITTISLLWSHRPQ